MQTLTPGKGRGRKLKTQLLLDHLLAHRRQQLFDMSWVLAHLQECDQVRSRGRGSQ